MNQHLVRSISRSAPRGACRSPNGDRLMPDPILVGRNAREGRGAGAARTASRAGRTDLDAALAEPDDTIYFDAGIDAAARGRCSGGDRRRQARLLREAGRRRRSTRRSALARLAQRAGVQARRRAGQAVPARAAQAQAAASTRGFFGRILVGARRVRLLGVRGRLAGGAAAVVELPRGGRRRHHPRHALPLALRARQPVRRGDGGDAASAPRTSPSAWTSTAAPTRRPPTTRPTRPSSSTAASIAQINSLLGDARAARRSRRRSRSTARTARRSPGCASAGSQHRGDTPRPVWNPDVPQTDRLLRALGGGAGQRRRTTTASRSQWELFLRHVVEDAPFRWNACSRARKGVQLAELGLRSWAERRWLDVPALRARERRWRRSAADARTDGIAAYTTCGPRRFAAAGARRPAATASPTRPRTSSPTRSPSNDPWLAPALDWEATLAYRQHLWALGLGVAEAMDTAQRGMGLDWPTPRELIRRSRRGEARGRRALIACGAGTDQLDRRRRAHARRRDRAPTRSSARRSRRSAGGSS